MEIKSSDDIECILDWVKTNTRLSNPGFYRYIFQRLYSDGSFDAVNADLLIRNVSKHNLWSDEANAESNVPMPILRDRFASRIRWINEVLGRNFSPYKDSLAIIYLRSTSRYQMITDPKKVKAFRCTKTVRKKPAVEVVIHSDDVFQGDPKLLANGELKFNVCSSITGFVHVFHADADGTIDKLFPEYNSNQCLKISRGRDLEFPLAVRDLCVIKRWVIGPMEKTEVEQRLLVLVTAVNVDISEKDVFGYFGLQSPNEKAIFKEENKLSDLLPSQVLHSVIPYRLISS